MEHFKKRWEIKHNWQLLFPLLGILSLAYASFKFAKETFMDAHIIVILLTAILFFYVLLNFFLFFFKKLENRWVVEHRWEMIRIFIVFAITGSSSALISKPIMAFMGITKENLNPIVYWVLYSIIGLIFYQILLVFFGWVFGQFKFFWEFEKKMLRRMGMKRFIKE